MKQNNIWEFQERINFSEGIDCKDGVLKWVYDCIPNATKIIKADLESDKNGTDFWIYRKNLEPLSVDLKNREFCPVEKFGSDDACIETTSVYKGRNDGQWKDENRYSVGWTINPKKRTDYIIYTWPTKNNKRRFWILPFHFLCMASIQNWGKWAKIYKERAAINDGYLTLSIYPPRAVIAKAMKKLMVGIC